MRIAMRTRGVCGRTATAYWTGLLSSLLVLRLVRAETDVRSLLVVVHTLWHLPSSIGSAAVNSQRAGRRALLLLGIMSTHALSSLSGSTAEMPCDRLLAYSRRTEDGELAH